MGRRGNFASVFFRWVPLIILSKYNVRVIGNLIQSCEDMRGRFRDPPYLASICVIRPLYIFSSHHWSLRALMSCSPMQVMYAFFKENASVPNMLWGSWVTALDIHLGRPHMIFLWRKIILLSSFLMTGRKYGTA